MQLMPSPRSSVIVVDDSSDDEPAPASGHQRVPVDVSSSDESEDSSPNVPKKNPPKFTFNLAPSAHKGLTYDRGSGSEEEEEISGVGNEPHGKKKKKAPRTTKCLFGQYSDSDDGMEEETTQIKFADSNGRMYTEGMSFSELQAQQREFERLRAKAHRKTTTVTGTKRKASGAASTMQSSPNARLKSSVLKKTASPSPFDFDFPGSSDESSASSSSAPHAGVLASRAKLMSLKDVVAQERKFARLRDKKTTKNTGQAAPPKKKSKTGPTASISKPLFSSSGTDSKSNVIDGTEWSESEPDDDDDEKDEAEEVLEESNNEDEFSDDAFIPSKSKTPSTQRTTRASEETSKTVKTSKSSGAKATSKSKGKKSNNKTRLSSAKPGTHVPLPGRVSDKLERPRTARDTVVHTTVWRNVCLDTAPINLLPLDLDVTHPFFSEFDRPLLTYDVDGDLRSRCKLLPQFGRSTHLIPSSLVSGEPTANTEEEMDAQVTALIQRELPRLRACHERKTTAVLAEARSKVRLYLAALDTVTKQLHQTQLKGKRLGDVGVLEKSLLNQMKQEKLTQQLSLGYSNVWGETIDVEEKLFPQDVNQLPTIRPLSKCTAYIGVKANVRVEDDPILRYKPYFGEDDDGADIDEAWYDEIGEKNSSLSSGLDGEVNEYLLRLIVREFGGSEKVFNALKKVTGFAQAYSDYAEMKKLDDSCRLAARRIKEAKGLISSMPEGFPLAKVAKLEPSLGDSDDSQKTLEERFAPPPTYFDSNLARNHANRGYGLGLRSADDYQELLVTYRDMFCRMCYDYHCLEHGIEHPLPSHRVDPINPPLHLSAVAIAATRKLEQESDAKKALKRDQDDSAEASCRTPESCASTVSPPGSVDTLDSSNLSAEDNSKHEDVRKDDENAATENGTVDVSFDTATDEEVAVTEEQHETRRSSRALTRISTLASKSIKKQAARPSRRKQSRPPRAQIYPEVADESEYLDDSHYDQVTSVVKKSLQADERCSTECWKAESHDTPGESVVKDDSKSVLSESEMVLVRKLRFIIGDNPCIISSMAKSTTCKEVGAFLEAERQSKPIRTSSMDDMPLSPDVRSKHNGRKRGRSSHSSNNRILLNRTRNNRLKDKGANHEYEPCNHEGACDSTDCSCMARDHTCEKACSCSRDCPNRFPGCKCSLGNCRTKACPCFIAARECNPDLCVTCGASEVPALIFDEERRNMSALDLGICCNVNILRGLHKKMGVAYSTTHGWGAFALENIKRGEFIYEYHGALLSQDEAERRGSIYDKMTISFLFDVDDDSVVDAIRKGNKSKFANHSAVDKKCKGKVLTVGGEHRISIWAQQDIAKGEELFFDYGYHGDTAPDWSQLRIKGAMRHGSKKKMEEKDKKKDQ
ncbi:Histone-lysine N-methyltransferase EZH1 [Phytophthora citrophthora]|uniref:Histone-lysine N-methyltransferase EZH1 n=1 Tax=Phytophthora citrophthora TaxID=4793 RepID=A0AAD9G243_9STRA|nr:Histone-lysine N-methyltransferase EZH1 [Phytophthora citrophthora]